MCHILTPRLRRRGLWPNFRRSSHTKNDEHCGDKFGKKNKANPSIQSAKEHETQCNQALTEQKDTDRPAESTAEQKKPSEP
ncbi:hypothetical protein Hypma_002774 [Hypsizygus marmoreus]|uniref:Uncharacterized protein n=1 Tax=Hypsizygus marmoreus TaxID=39966 RepID=A0A369J9I2_HYPMA|nr:hypothetical protein Hypma_002774 [Hypsizygus marmoreus]